MTKKKSNIIFLLGCIYAIISLGFIIINFPVLDIYDLLGFIFSLGFLFFCYKKKKENHRLFWIIICLFLIIRIALLFLHFNPLANDYAYFYQEAINYATKSPLNKEYLSLYPYLYFYVATLGGIMRLFGTSYTVVIALNLIVELLGGVVFYLIAKDNYDNNIAKKALLLYICNPFSFLWIVKCCPVIIVNSLLLLIIYLHQKIMKVKKIKYMISLSLLLGVIMSIANHFRPIIIIFVITLVIMLGLTMIYHKEQLKKSGISLICILLPYFCLNICFNQIISDAIGYELPKNGAGWSIYVGANYEYRGRWNLKDSEYFDKLVEEKGNVEAQRLIQQEGVDRYKSLGVKSVWLWMKKAVVLGGGLPNYTYNEFFNFIGFNSSMVLVFSFKLFLYFYLLLIMIMNFKSIFKNIKMKKVTVENLLLPIFIIGLFCSMLLVEVSERYFLPIMVLIMVYATNYYVNEDS